MKTKFLHKFRLCCLGYLACWTKRALYSISTLITVRGSSKRTSSPIQFLNFFEFLREMAADRNRMHVSHDTTLICRLLSILPILVLFGGHNLEHPNWFFASPNRSNYDDSRLDEKRGNAREGNRNKPNSIRSSNMHDPDHGIKSNHSLVTWSNAILLLWYVMNRRCVQTPARRLGLIPNLAKRLSSPCSILSSGKYIGERVEDYLK